MTEITLLLETKLEARLKPLMNEITKLREENRTKDQLLKEPGNRVEDLDQQAKRNDVFLI